MRSLALTAAALLAGCSTVSLDAAIAPTFYVSAGSTLDNTPSIPVLVLKSAKAASYSRIQLDTVDDTAKAGTDFGPVHVLLTFGNNESSKTVLVPIIARPGYQGPRSFKVTITAKRFAKIGTGSTSVGITDSEPAPPPVTTPPPTQTCWDGSTIPATSPCPIQPLPTPGPGTKWAVSTAPIGLGSFVFTKPNQPQGCCNGLIQQVVGTPVLSGDADPAKRQPLWLLQPYADPTGNFPFTSSSYEATLQLSWPESDLQAVIPQ